MRRDICSKQPHEADGKVLRDRNVNEAANLSWVEEERTRWWRPRFVISSPRHVQLCVVAVLMASKGYRVFCGEIIIRMVQDNTNKNSDSSISLKETVMIAMFNERLFR